MHISACVNKVLFKSIRRSLLQRDYPETEILWLMVKAWNCGVIFYRLVVCLVVSELNRSRRDVLKIMIDRIHVAVKS